jgi:hypothetical protein
VKSSTKKPKRLDVCDSFDEFMEQTLKAWEQDKKRAEEKGTIAPNHF